MKIRHDFVTNSSSSSFVIEKKDLTQQQIDLLLDYNFLCKFLNIVNDGWSIHENDTQVYGYTIINNDYIEDFFKVIGVDLSKIYIDDDN